MLRLVAFELVVVAAAIVVAAILVLLSLWSDPVPVQLITYGLLKEAKNPNTAKLLIHWLTTPEGAKVYEDAVYRGNPYVEGTEMERLIGSRNIAYHEGERLAEFKSMTEIMIKLLEKNR